MKEFYPTAQTTVFLTLFLVIYVWMLLRRAVVNKLDLYDFFMLSTVALVPAVFVFAPRLVNKLARLTGVEFPFLLLFGAINLITFVMLYRLIRRTNKLKADLVTLVQELGIKSEQLAALAAQDRERNRAQG